MKIPARFPVLLIFLVISFYSYSQEFYTARSYWIEATKEPYRKLLQKQTVGDSLTTNEITYMLDYQTYLASYFNRLPEAEKIKYEQMKQEWNREFLTAPKPELVKEEFEWRARDRFLNALYGVYYGASIVAIGEIDNAAAVGLPLITGGLWLMGPVINPKRYEGITRTTIRASHTGKFLGLIYGGALGAAIAGDSDDPSKMLLGLSSVGSIALGEIGFQLQKKRNFSDGHIEMLRLYGILGPWISTSILLSTESLASDDPNAVGVTILAGGVAGLITGNAMSKRYDYSRGDVDAISSLALISTGVGFMLMAESFQNEEADALILIPAASSIIGTLWGQKIVKGAYLTKKQGSTISFSTAGAALIGLGFAALLESESPSVTLGLTSGLALLTHQLVFYKYKRENLLKGFQGKDQKKGRFHFSMNVTPENYLINQRIPAREYNPRTNAQVSNPLIKLKVTF